MSSTFSAQDKVGDIVIKFPSASDIFKKHKIDFCCGGNRTLQEACKDNFQQVLQEIEEEYKASQNKPKVDYASLSTPELIKHIVDTHHGYLRRELPKIEEMALKVCRAHYHHDAGAMFRKLYPIFTTLKTDLDIHLIDEEKELFPLMEKGEKDNEVLQKFLKQTKEEHEVVGGLLAQIREMTKDYTFGKDLCATCGLLFAKLQELESDIFQHVHLENNVLWKRFELPK